MYAMQKNRYEKKLEWVEKKARALGADAVRSSLRACEKFAVSQRDGTIENMTESVETSLFVEVFLKDRYSVHSTSDLHEERLGAFLEKAVSITAHLEKDPDRRLPDPGLYPGNQRHQDLDQVDPSLPSMSVHMKTELLDRLVSSAYDTNPGLLSVTGSFWNERALSAMRASNGFSNIGETTMVGMGINVAVAEPDGRKPEASHYVYACHFSDLWKPEQVSGEAVRQVESRLGARKIPSARMTMVLKNTQTPQMLIPILEALSGGALWQKQSFLEGKQNKPIATPLFTLLDDPLIPRAMGSRFFDGEGIKAVRRPIIDRGVLKNYLIDSYYGNKLNLELTTGWPSNVILSLGSQSPQELIASVQKGIYVTGFLGGDSNPATGDFSYGIIGHEIHEGQLAGPVSEMVVSSNYLELMQSLKAIGNDPNEFSTWRAPTLVFDNADFSGL